MICPRCNRPKDKRSKLCRECWSKAVAKIDCSIIDCNKEAWSRGWCPMHYRRWRKYGDTSIVQKGPESDYWNHRGSYFGCWEWTGHTTNKGKKGREYGFVMIDGTRSLVHRLVWEAIYETIPEGMEVCHKCDNPKCWRPDHLFLGSHEENMKDKVAKGRQNLNFAVGFRLPHTKLSEEDVLEIRRLWETGTSNQTEIAKKFGISQAHTSNVVNNKSRITLDANREYAKLSKSYVWEKDNGICGVCSLPAKQDDWDLDHIIPLSRGGSDTYDNVQVSHPRCNRQKGSKNVDNQILV